MSLLVCCVCHQSPPVEAPRQPRYHLTRLLLQHSQAPLRYLGHSLLLLPWVPVLNETRGLFARRACGQDNRWSHVRCPVPLSCILTLAKLCMSYRVIPASALVRSLLRGTCEESRGSGAEGLPCIDYALLISQTYLTKSSYLPRETDVRVSTVEVTEGQKG